VLDQERVEALFGKKKRKIDEHLSSRKQFDKKIMSKKRMKSEISAFQLFGDSKSTNAPSTINHAT